MTDNFIRMKGWQTAAPGPTNLAPLSSIQLKTEGQL
jgi:hypothetical protein